MRRLFLALALVLALPVAAAADYRRLGPASPYEQEIALAGAEIIAASTERRLDALVAYGLDGGRRTLVPLGHEGFLYSVAASPQAIAAVTSRGPWAGPLAGPLTTIAEDPGGVAVTGPTVLTLDGGWVVARDVAAGGAPRRVVRPGDVPDLLKAAGPYFAVVVGHEAPDSAIVVYEIATGRELYRVVSGPVDGYDLGLDGRIVLVDGTRGRVPIRTATPAQPRLTTIARLPVTPYVALGGDAIALARRGPVSRLILLGLDGVARRVSGPTGPITSIDYDGTTLAFTAGGCLYGGIGPAGPPATDGCFDRAPRLRKWRLRNRRVIAPLTCRVPPGAHCTGELQLVLHGRKLARRALKLTPGDHVVRLRVRRRHEQRARRAELYVVA